MLALLPLETAMAHKSIARMQYRLEPADLELVLALVRGGTLPGAAERLQVDASTAFRQLQRLERNIGQRLFERSRSGYRPTELGGQLAAHGEEMEVAVESARSSLASGPTQVSGTVRITTTDTILHGLVAPSLQALQSAHPLLEFDLHTGNELANLSRRDSDIAVRATRRPPPHLVGRKLGPIRNAVYAARGRGAPRWKDVEAGRADWIAVDDALPEHPSVGWRKRHFPKVVPRYRVGSVQSVLELVALGLGVGIAPIFLADRRATEVTALTGALEDAETELWLLTHPQSRHLRRVAVTYAHLSETLRL
jgi:DNA-binding transcriptional LysR family regulator